MKTYLITFKVYERATIYEIPFRVPPEMVDEESRLKLGYQTVKTELKEEEYVDIMRWAGKNQGVLKVIGIQRP